MNLFRQLRFWLLSKELDLKSLEVKIYKRWDINNLPFVRYYAILKDGRHAVNITPILFTGTSDACRVIRQSINNFKAVNNAHP